MASHETMKHMVVTSQESMKHMAVSSQDTQRKLWYGQGATQKMLCARSRSAPRQHAQRCCCEQKCSVSPFWLLQMATTEWTMMQCGKVRDWVSKGARFFQPGRPYAKLPSPKRHAHVRVGMIMPWKAPSEDTDRHVADFMQWLPLWEVTARRNADLFDFLVIHEAGDADWMERALPSRANSNVRRVSVSSFAKLIEQRLGVPTSEQRRLSLLSNLRPAFGFVFQELLSNYSHWGW